MSEKFKYIELRFVDILGRLKGMIVPCSPAERLDELRADSVLKTGTSIDGSSITGMASVESSDLRLQPDLNSLVELPHTLQRTAAVLCFVQKKAGVSDDAKFHPKDTRTILHRIHDDLLPGNMQLRVQLEPEFHFITPEGGPFDYAEYADIYPTNPSADILLEIATTIQEMGIDARVIHHEAGNAQLEIEIAYRDARKAADNMILFKNIAKAVTYASGIDVTFMPKPFSGSAGNGMHCHLQLWEGEKNLFGDPNTGGLSEIAKSFIAGLLEHAPALTAIANPTVNSYKRLVPHHEAPVYICWGPMNRTTLVRIPLFTDASKAAIEFRSPDPMTNPYLLFASVIAAGMDGIKRNLQPPEPRTEDVFHMSEEEREKYGIRMLPATLAEAIDALEHDEVIKKAIGDELVEDYIGIKRKEWNDYVSQIVTQWEWTQYSDA